MAFKAPASFDVFMKKIYLFEGGSVREVRDGGRGRESLRQTPFANGGALPRAQPPNPEITTSSETSQMPLSVFFFFFF